MISCRPGTLASGLVVASLVFAAWNPSEARADALSASNTYVLLSSQAIPASTSQASGPLVVFDAPANSIVPGPADSSGNATSPVTPIATTFTATDGKTYTTDPQYTTSQNVFVFTRETTSTTGQPVEELGFAFKNGLSANSPFVFSLNLANPSSPPTLTAVTPGVANYPFPAPAATSTPATSTTITTTTATSTSVGRPPVDQPIPGPTVPEPFSLALWSTLTAAGFFKARAARRQVGLA